MTIKVEGLEGSVLFLGGLAKGEYMKRPLIKFGQNIKKNVAPYAQAPPTSTYRRTGNLGRRWYATPAPDKVTVQNLARYSGYVQSSPTQAWFHKRTGWKTVEDEAEKLIPALNKDIDKEIKRLDNATRTN